MYFAESGSQALHSGERRLEIEYVSNPTCKMTALTALYDSANCAPRQVSYEQ
jgi:hypothetical protein